MVSGALAVVDRRYIHMATGIAIGAMLRTAGSVQSAHMTLDPMQVREDNLARVRELRFPLPPVHFPVLWEPAEAYKLRSQQARLERAAVLNVVIARTFGMPQDLAFSWLTDNDLRDQVTSDEEDLLQVHDATESPLSGRVEALWCLMWTLGVAGHLDPTRYCEDDLVASVPDLRASEPYSAWPARLNTSPRTADEVAEQLDLYYCLTWGVANANLTGQPAPGQADQYVLWQRRHALEWVLMIGDHAEDSWDDVDLST